MLGRLCPSLHTAQQAFGGRARERIDVFEIAQVAVIRIRHVLARRDAGRLGPEQCDPKSLAALVRAGASRTKRSRHLTGHAVDVAALVEGQVRWDWPLYGRIASAFKAAALELKTPIVWGGDWKTLRDGPHFELDRKAFP